MLAISKRKKMTKLKSMGDHDEFLNRITKSLYYAKLPVTDCLSLPVTELAAELFTEVKNGKSLDRLDVDEASKISQKACVSPCSLILALLYLERLKDCNPEYLQQVASSELFLVSLMIANKFLNDDGEEDEVFNEEWAQSGDISTWHMNQLEKEFLHAINWTIFVQNQDFWNKLKKLEQDIAYREAKKRGWFTYTELTCLLNSMQLMTVAQALITASSICLATYAAGIATLLASAIIGSQVPGSLLSFRQNPAIHTEVSDLISITKVDTLSMSANETEKGLKINFIDIERRFNESCVNCSIEKDNEDMSWKWWLRSLMTWLPEYANTPPTESLQLQNIYYPRNIETFTDRPVISVKHWTLPKSNPLLSEIYWKEILGFDDKSINWRYYLNFFTKTLFNH